MTMHRRVLVLGGARSGKSRIALQLAESASPERTYIATAQAFDDEMRERIAQHRMERDASWQTIDAPLELCDALRDLTAPGKVVLVDCLTLWLSNIILADRDPEPETERLVRVDPGGAWALSSWSRTRSGTASCPRPLSGDASGTLRAA